MINVLFFSINKSKYWCIFKIFIKIVFFFTTLASTQFFYHWLKWLLVSMILTLKKKKEKSCNYILKKKQFLKTFMFDFQNTCLKKIIPPTYNSMVTLLKFQDCPSTHSSSQLTHSYMFLTLHDKSRELIMFVNFFFNF